mgnify:FL=1|jgi:hypothetical protein|tara:strand:- start:72 stop:326 length:255 start_codon:yes stop_codon:yes gene_type:complete
MQKYDYRFVAKSFVMPDQNIFDKKIKEVSDLGFRLASSLALGDSAMVCVFERPRPWSEDSYEDWDVDNERDWERERSADDGIPY